ncbi:LuxR C-terminal-related transcriptional regulator [Amycolatopsis minnesotensis]|uniref:HTH luxR-type domain-containing protein n=1 Tax=Amycolatopsis minnesotensis TaxID=337894 RepID=A0ABN2SP55_9PSEU
MNRTRARRARPPAQAAESALEAGDRAAAAALAADGHSNRKIAEEPFIPVKTVGVHASSIFGKPGVTSRVQAATLAHRLGIV